MPGSHGDGRLAGIMRDNAAAGAGTAMPQNLESGALYRVPQMSVRLVTEKWAVICGNAKKPSDGACH